MATPTNNHQQQEPEIDEAFAERNSVILQEWQAGQLTASQAEQALNELLQEAEADDNRMNQGGVELYLGIIQGYLANFTACARHFETARQHFKAVGAYERVVTCDLNIGETYRLQGNFTRAQLFFHRAYERGKELDNQRTMAVALTNEGQMWLSMGSYHKAEESLQEALRISSEPYPDEADELIYTARLGVLAEIYNALTQLSLIEDKPIKAWKYAKLSYENAQATGHPMRLGFGNRAIADAISALGDAPEPEFDSNPDVYYKKALDYFKEVKMEGDYAKTLFARGQSLVRRGRKSAAAKLFQQAMVLFTKLGMTDDVAKAAEAQTKAIF
jgi:tetratricopeptide (TPR) repeat protein